MKLKVKTSYTLNLDAILDLPENHPLYQKAKEVDFDEEAIESIIDNWIYEAVHRGTFDFDLNLSKIDEIKYFQKVKGGNKVDGDTTITIGKGNFSISLDKEFPETTSVTIIEE